MTCGLVCKEHGSACGTDHRQSLGAMAARTGLPIQWERHAHVMWESTGKMTGCTGPFAAPPRPFADEVGKEPRSIKEAER